VSERQVIIVFLSGVFVYGEIRDVMITERPQICNPDTYGLTKLVGQDIVQQQGTITVYILRLPGVLVDGASSPWLVRQIQKAIQNADAPFNNAVWVGGSCRFVYELLKNLLQSTNFFFWVLQER